MKIAVVIACGNKKQSKPLPAWQLYKSPRIKAVYKRKGKYDMYILSAQHGLLPAEKEIELYNRISFSCQFINKYKIQFGIEWYKNFLNLTESK